MAIIHTTDDLLEESPSIFLPEFAMLDNVVKQLSTTHILHHHEDVSGGADHLVQLDNVWVSEQFQILNFSPDLSNYIQVLNLLPVIQDELFFAAKDYHLHIPVQDLDSHLVPCQLMEPNLDFTKCANPQGLPQDVVAYLHLRSRGQAA